MAAEWGKHCERHYHIITGDVSFMSAGKLKPVLNKRWYRNLQSSTWWHKPSLNWPVSFLAFLYCCNQLQEHILTNCSSGTFSQHTGEDLPPCSPSSCQGGLGLGWWRCQGRSRLNRDRLELGWQSALSYIDRMRRWLGRRPTVGTYHHSRFQGSQRPTADLHLSRKAPEKCHGRASHGDQTWWWAREKWMLRQSDRNANGGDAHHLM